jgi:class 3 adenylate cyclase
MPESLARKIRQATATLAGERKVVTVLFCNLAEVAALAERLDPEEYREVLERHLERAALEVYRYEGIVNQVAGTSMMTLFGAPVAHEDAPQRALWAALAIRAAVADLGAGEGGAPLAVQIGINTGPVVVGAVGNDLKMDYSAVGDTTNLAARLASLAAPGAILVSETTARLVGRFFELRTVGPFAVKGKRGPVPAHEVQGAFRAATPMAIAAERGLTPLVGRDGELAALEACYRRLAAGRAQVVAVVGEAGTGKSRLLHEFKERLAGEPVALFEARCSSLAQAVPYFPFVGMFQSHFRLAPGADTSQGVDAGRGSLFEVLSRLLTVPAEALRQRGAEELRRESFDAAARFFLDQSQRAPVVVLIEDLHWIDEPSRELLGTVLARVAEAPVMVVASHRPDERITWPARTAFTQLVLDRLSDEHVLSIIRAVAGGQAPAELERRLVGRADGHPFFAEEITRALLESGYLARDNGAWRLTRPADDVPVPATVQEVIAARLDRLGADAKRVIQVAAVLGRQFRRDQLARLVDGEGIDVGLALEELEARGLVHRPRAFSADELRFGESLTQEVAYESLLLKLRRQLHERVGRLLEASPGTRPALLAYHFARGTDRRKGLEALLGAGRDAERLPSTRAAFDFFRQAWEVAEALLGEDGGEDVRRAALEAAMGVARVVVTYGLPHLPEAERAAGRAAELAEALGDTPARVGLAYYRGRVMMQGDREQFDRGLAVVEEGLALAEREGLVTPALAISRGLAIQYTNDGRFALARRTAEWTVEQLERTAEREQLTDIYVSARWVRDNALYLSDELDAVVSTAAETHALAVRAPNRISEGAAAGTLAQAHFLRGSYGEARRWADAALEVAESAGNYFALPPAAAIAALSRVALGERVDAARYADAIEHGLAAAQANVNFRFVAEALTGLGERRRVERFAAQLRAFPFSGRLREAMATADRGLVAQWLGQERDAARRYADAITVADAIGARSVLAVSLLGAAEVAAARGDAGVATRQAERAATLCRELKLGRYEPRVAAVLHPPAGAGAAGEETGQPA